MAYLILQDYSSIKEKMNTMFSVKTRNQKRIIIVNYLDGLAPDMFPDVFDVTIFCHPQPGNIDPYAIEELQMKGAKIYFTNIININVYYVENEGVLIGSANYNYSLLVLKESISQKNDLIVFVEDHLAINIENIINSLEANLMSKRDLEDFKEKHHIFWKIYEGFELHSNPIVKIKNTLIDIESQMKSCNKIIACIKSLKNLFKLSRKRKKFKISHNNLLSFEPNYDFNASHLYEKSKKDIDKKLYNIYTISKSDLLEILTDKASKLGKQKKNLH